MGKQKQKISRHFKRPEVLFLGSLLFIGILFTATNAGSNGKSSVIAEYSSGNYSNYSCDELKSMTAKGDYYAEAEYNKRCTSGEKQYTQEQTQETETTQSTSQYNCDELKAMKEKGLSLSAEQKDYYLKYCAGTPSTESCPDGYHKNSQGKCAADENTASPEDSKPAEKFCYKLQYVLSHENYTDAEKQKYDELCPNGEPVESVCAKLHKQIESGNLDLTVSDFNSEDVFKKLCTYQPKHDKQDNFCADLSAKIEEYSNQPDSQDYLLAKQKYTAYCEKNIPPAGYEDVVITDDNSKDNPFTDTEMCSLGGKAAFELYRRAVIGGFKDGTFKGDNPVNRAEAAKFLLLARYGKVDDAENNGRFSDISGKPWFIRYITKASELGIINGHPDGTYKPADGVSVAEFLKMLALTFDLETDLPYGYKDVPSDAWYAKYAGLAEKYNLFPGQVDTCSILDNSSTTSILDSSSTTSILDNTSLDPSHKLTRYEVAVAIYQFLVNRGFESLESM